VLATLDGIGAALGRPVPPDYAILLTGQDYPLRSNAEIARVLEAAGGRSFMEHGALPRAGAWEPERGGLDRIERRYVPFRGGLQRLPGRRRRRLPGARGPFGGSAHWILARPCLEEILRVVAAEPALLRFFRWAKFPDELVFQTILLNSPLAATIVDDDLRHTEWRAGAANPDVLGIEAMERLRASRALFARKFDLERAPAVLDRLDELRGDG
jgi:hypothetical protein